MFLTGEPPYPSGLGAPTAGWIFSTAMPIVWAAVLVVVVIHTGRNRRFGVQSLMFLAGTTMFWIEWPADWGSYLVYNREFPMFEGWTSTWFQTYWKPVPVVFGYGIFFGIAAVIFTRVMPRIQKLFSQFNPTLVVIVASAVIFYVFDIAAEKTMTSLGWYSYAEPVGPAWYGEKGNISFVWPAVPFLLFAVIESLIVTKARDGIYPNERLFGVATMTDGFRKEATRLFAWVISSNILIFTCQPLALIIGRTVFNVGVGDQSIYNP
ncbi:MAG: spirocyclase AveC family protein [Aeromicrobium sp.]